MRESSRSLVILFVHCKCSAVVCRDIGYCGPIVCKIHKEKFKGVNGQGCYSLYTKELPQLLLVVGDYEIDVGIVVN